MWILALVVTAFVAVSVLNEVRRRVEAARTIGSLRGLVYLSPAERLLVRARGTMVSVHDELQRLRLLRERLQVELVFGRHGTAAGLHEVLARNPHYEGSVAHRAVAHAASLPRPVLLERSRGMTAQPIHGRMTSRIERQLMKVELKIIRLESLTRTMSQPGIQLGTREQLAQGPLRDAVVACENEAMRDSVRHTLRARQGEFEPELPAISAGAGVSALSALEDLELSFGDEEAVQPPAAPAQPAPAGPFGGLFLDGLDSLMLPEEPEETQKSAQPQEPAPVPEQEVPPVVPPVRRASLDDLNLPDL